MKEDTRPTLEPVITQASYGAPVPDYDFSAGESPTKLYSMWAMQEQLDRRTADLSLNKLTDLFTGKNLKPVC